MLFWGMLLQGVGLFLMLFATTFYHFAALSVASSIIILLRMEPARSDKQYEPTG